MPNALRFLTGFGRAENKSRASISRCALATNDNHRNGTVLVISLFTITILTLICATSLYITSQCANAGAQAATWQQALTAAETGVDAAVRALNDDGQTGAWTNWITTTQSGTNLPFSEPTPSPSPSATAAPDSTHYNYLPSSNLTLNFPNTEGNSSVSAWVTIDTAGMSSSQDTNGKQWYRVRSTGQAAVSGLIRVSNNRLDNDLRNTVALRFIRRGGTALCASRTIEVILQPLATSGWARGITLKSWISMSGGGLIDSYDSSNPFKSTNGSYDATKRQSHGDVGTDNSGTGSNLGNTYVYGNLSYSGSAVKNTTNVKGTISTPFNVSIPSQSAPTWTPTNTYTGGGSNPPNNGLFTAGANGSPTYIKVSGDLTISSSGHPLHIQQADTNANNQIYIWVTGKLTTSGTGYISQDSNVKVTFYVGGDITLSGGSYINNTGLAADLAVVGYGSNNKITVSGSADFIGTFNAPNYDVTISGGGFIDGALIGNTITMSGGSGFHYDEALGNGGTSSTIGNYAFASWFEDNAAATHKDQNGHYVVY